MLTSALGVLAFFVLHVGTGDAAPNLDKIASPARAVHATLAALSQTPRKVRIIPLFRVPKDAVSEVPPQR